MFFIRPYLLFRLGRVQKPFLSERFAKSTSVYVRRRLWEIFRPEDTVLQQCFWTGAVSPPRWNFGLSTGRWTLLKGVVGGAGEVANVHRPVESDHFDNMFFVERTRIRRIFCKLEFFVWIQHTQYAYTKIPGRFFVYGHSGM